jgi:hypothetical protein
METQLLAIEDDDRVKDAQSLYRICDQFKVLLEHLSAQPSGGNCADA